MISLLLLVAPEAAAWRHLGEAWPELPVTVCVDGAGVDPSWVDEVHLAIDGWNDAASTRGLEPFDVVGCDEAAVVVRFGTTPSWIEYDAENGAGSVPVGGCSYGERLAVEIVVDVTAFVPYEDVLDGSCQGGISLPRVMAHELGHALGLAHNCEQLEPCTDPAAADALMYWTLDPCELRYTPGADDLDGLEALYGTPTCDPFLAEADDTGFAAPAPDPDHIEPAPPAEEAGCGCRTDAGPATLAWLVVLLLVRRR